MLRTLIATALLVCAPVFAKPLPGQFKPCDAKTKCEAGLQCISTTAGKRRCERLCDQEPRCPEDQRCMKDGPAQVCRAITDGVPGL